MILKIVKGLCFKLKRRSLFAYLFIETVWPGGIRNSLKQNQAGTGSKADLESSWQAGELAYNVTYWSH